MIDEILDTVIHGDALDVLKNIEDNSIDAICCDPPAGIGFMQTSKRDWDSNKGGKQQWVAWLSEIMKECYRVLKPGSHALIWSLPRTSHWTGNALEDAGFQIRDNIYNLVSGDTILLNFLQSLSEEQQHAFIQVLDAQREPSGILQIFGQGFPKSLSVDKQIDKMLGKEREVIGKSARHVSGKPNQRTEGLNGSSTFSEPIGMGQFITAPASEAAKQYSGFGSALKPACENWWLVRKPLAASSIAENVLQYGTGAINIDATRVAHDEQCRTMKAQGSIESIYQQSGRYEDTLELKPSGRWPSHLLLTHTPSCIQVGTKRVRGDGHKTQNPITQSEASLFGNGKSGDARPRFNDEDGMETVTAWECPDFCPVRILDLQSGASNSRISVKGKAGNAKFNGKYNNGEVYANASDQTGGYTDSGGASRYFAQFPALDDIPPYIYAGKASRKDRNAGCEDIPEKQGVKQFNVGMEGKERSDGTVIKDSTKQHNTHPTVKSQPLMKYLTRMICPPNGIVLDCFCGSGSTLVAAIYEGFHFIGIEKEDEYVNIARARIDHAMSITNTKQPIPDIPLATSTPTKVRKKRNISNSSQLSLWDTEEAI